MKDGVSRTVGLHHATHSAHAVVMIVATGFLTASALAGLQSFTHLDAIGSRHLLAANSYGALIGDAVAEMARAVPSRRSVTLAMADYRARSQLILMAAPYLPDRCWCPTSGSLVADIEPIPPPGGP